jgi:hypothetical protein
MKHVSTIMQHDKIASFQRVLIVLHALQHLLARYAAITIISAAGVLRFGAFAYDSTMI